MTCIRTYAQRVIGFLFRNIIYNSRDCIIAVAGYVDCYGLNLLNIAAAKGVKVLLFYDHMKCNKRELMGNLAAFRVRQHYKHYMADGVFFLRGTGNLTRSELEGVSRNVAELEVIVGEKLNLSECSVAAEVLRVILDVLSEAPRAIEIVEETLCVKFLRSILHTETSLGTH